MKLIKIKNKIKNVFTVYGHYLTAVELSKYSTSQLADAGISKQQLSLGVSAYPWRLAAVSQDIPDNASKLNATNAVNETQVMPRTPKAA